MIALLRLGVLCVVLAGCRGACFHKLHEAVIKEGKLVEPVCIDLYDETIHRIGDSWNTAKCLQCSCSTVGLNCCTRYGDVVDVEGCIEEVDQTT